MVQSAMALGYFLSSVFNHQTSAVAFAPIINLPLNLLGGYMINLKGIFKETPQRYIAWLTYLSPVRYGFEGMVKAQFPVPNEPNTDNVSEELGFNIGYWGCVLGLFVLFVLFRFLTVVSLTC